MKSSHQCASSLAQRLFGIQGFMTILSNKFETIGMFTERTSEVSTTSFTVQLRSHTQNISCLMSCRFEWCLPSLLLTYCTDKALLSIYIKSHELQDLQSNSTTLEGIKCALNGTSQQMHGILLLLSQVASLCPVSESADLLRNNCFAYRLVSLCQALMFWNNTYHPVLPKT